jgi:hypothetical protein
MAKDFFAPETAGFAFAPAGAASHLER